MKQLAVLTVLIVGGVLAWLLGSRLSADALGMAVGLMFGVLAGIPTALLVLASGRRRRAEAEDDEEEHAPNHPGGYGYGRGMNGAYPFQPPVIVLAAPQQAAPPPQPWPHPQTSYPQTVDSVGYPVRQALPGPGAPAAPGGRVFKVVGEKEELLDEW